VESRTAHHGGGVAGEIVLFVFAVDLAAIASTGGGGGAGTSSDTSS
jgi:hypothetical protein